MGAGLIPFCALHGRVQFLFQKVFSGRKTGFLIDFGGGLAAGEDHKQTATREFVEETETMFFSSDIRSAARTPTAVATQLPHVRRLLERTQREHPDWWCQRETGSTHSPKDWRTYFVEVEYTDLAPMNDEWRAAERGRFKKRRELVWVAAEDLLTIYQRSPEKLWKRVRQLRGAETIIRSIRLCKERTNTNSVVRNGRHPLRDQ